MTKVRLEPYVGEKYLSEGYKGKRIMVLGKNHYHNIVDSYDKELKDVEEEKRFSTWCFDEGLVNYYDGGDHYRWMDTWTNLSRAVTGLQEKEAQKDFWQRAMFYSFIQRFTIAENENGEKIAKIAIPIDTKDWEYAPEPFFEVLKEYKPDLVIVCGKDVENRLNYLYNQLPETFSIFGIECKKNDVVMQNGLDYIVDGKTIHCVFIKHPSIGFCKDFWSPRLQDAVREC